TAVSRRDARSNRHKLNRPRAVGTSASSVPVIQIKRTTHQEFELSRGDSIGAAMGGVEIFGASRMAGLNGSCGGGSAGSVVRGASTGVGVRSGTGAEVGCVVSARSV